jgi:hypothetical protein
MITDQKPRLKQIEQTVGRRQKGKKGNIHGTHMKERRKRTREDGYRKRN